MTLATFIHEIREAFHEAILDDQARCLVEDERAGLTF